MATSKIARLLIFYTWMAIFLTSCSAIADIFKAGVWTGVVVVIFIVAIIIFIIAKSRKQ